MAQLQCKHRLQHAQPRSSRRQCVTPRAALPQPHQQGCSTSQQVALASAAAAAILQLSVASSSSAAPLYDNLPGFGAPTPFSEALSIERQMRAGNDIDDLFDENLMTQQLKDYLDALMGGKMPPEQYQSERLKMNFKRALDGRVELRSRQGRWYSVRPDMQVPGFLLLRESSSGGVFFLPPDERDGIEQFDLSDDAVVAELFSNTAWQDVMRPLSYRDEAGAVQQLQLTEAQFRNVVSLLEEAEEEMPPEPAQ